jgi:hypothetical protein
LDVAKLFPAAGPKIASIAVGDHEKIETEIEWKGGSSSPPAIVTAGDRFAFLPIEISSIFQNWQNALVVPRGKNEFTVACALLLPLGA